MNNDEFEHFDLENLPQEFTEPANQQFPPDEFQMPQVEPQKQSALPEFALAIGITAGTIAVGAAMLSKADLIEKLFERFQNQLSGIFVVETLEEYETELPSIADIIERTDTL